MRRWFTSLADSLDRCLQPHKADAGVPDASGGGRQAPGAAWFLASILLIALAFSVWQALLAANRPVFRGDEGARLLGASFPIVKMGNRVWLPMLQTHIWALHLFHIPPTAFRAIPVFYGFVSLVTLGLLGWKLLGRSRSTLWFLPLLLVCFASQRHLLGLGHSLMQESVEIALFFLLLLFGALEPSPRWWILLLAGAAMLTRDSFWIYLAAFTLLRLRQILRAPRFRLAVLAVWTVPVFWLLMIPPFIRVVFHRWPRFPLEWPLMINKDSGQTISRFKEGGANLWQAVSSGRTWVLLVALVVVGALLLLSRKIATPPRMDGFARRFIPFSLVALAIVYALILLFNPWEATGGSDRITLPFLEHAFVWVILLFGWVTALPRGALRIASQTVLCAGLLLSVCTDGARWRIGEPSPISAQFASLERALQKDGPMNGRKSCYLFVDTIWPELERLAPPTMYTRHEFVDRRRPAFPADCDYIYLRTPVTETIGGDYHPLGEFEIAGLRYAVFSRR